MRGTRNRHLESRSEAEIKPASCFLLASITSSHLLELGAVEDRKGSSGIVQTGVGWGVQGAFTLIVILPVKSHTKEETQSIKQMGAGRGNNQG